VSAATELDDAKKQRREIPFMTDSEQLETTGSESQT
jgi:hypothetical protein